MNNIQSDGKWSVGGQEKNRKACYKNVSRCKLRLP